MQHLLWLIPMAPLACFLILATIGARLSRKMVAWIGVGVVGMSTILAMLTAARFIYSPPAERIFTQTLWTWIDVGGFTPTVAFTLDALSLIMTLVVAFVSFLILLYSTEFMEKEEGYSRFFAYMNLFVGSMLTLVLADNLFLLYFGWEGVGLCSYLLIGFWYKDPVNGAAARKAFIVTRIGDAAMAIGLFLLFDRLGTLNIQELMRRAVHEWPPGCGLAVAAAALLLAGAVGKSAQWPLQTWLPDAMAGPAPVSALIHAATMVTAGVYLIARTHVLFQLAPSVQWALAMIGAATLIMAGFSALVQSDIKRVLAYSTISQIGYMFLALGVGAWSAAIFHFMTHAFFKALLFLGAGVVVQRLDDEHNIYKMGGLWNQLPFTFCTFLIGACSLSALPLVTAGFYSKDLILSEAWSCSRWLWGAGLLGALLTSLYTFRMLFLVFLGKTQRRITEQCGLRIQIPLAALAALSVVGGFFALPDFLRTMIPSTTGIQSGVLELAAALVSMGGIYLAYLLFLRHRQLVERMAGTSLGNTLRRFWFSGWGFDWLYDELLVRPYVWLARVNKDDVIDLVYQATAWVVEAFHRALRRTQSGSVRRYAMGITFGAVLIVTLVLFG